jgi:hypothetical protein
VSTAKSSSGNSAERLFEIHMEALAAFREVKKIDEGQSGLKL